METLTTEEKNIIVAKFDGWVPTGRIHPYTEELGPTYSKEGLMGVSWAAKLEYNNSPNLLFPVIAKIPPKFHVMITRWEDINMASISDPYTPAVYFRDNGENLMDVLFEVMVQFIIWYNQNKQS